MAPKAKPRVVAKNVQGLKYFHQLQPLLARLHEVGTESDRSGNRQLFFNDYAALILLFFFNPSLDSLRALQQASCLDKVQKKLGCRQTSLGSLSAAARDFDAEPLQAIVGELAQQVLPLTTGKDAELLRGLTAVDGSLLPALPKMAWALWVDEEHRAAKLHLHFDVFKGVPCHATVTEGNANEKQELRAALQAGRLYVIDRGYAEYQLFQDIIDARSSFIGRIRDNAVYQVIEERPLSADARQAGVVRDCVVHLGCEASGAVFKQPLRVVEVATGKTDSQGRPELLLLASDCLDLDAAWIALGYKYRWTVEINQTNCTSSDSCCRSACPGYDSGNRLSVPGPMAETRRQESSRRIRMSDNSRSALPPRPDGNRSRRMSARGSVCRRRVVRN